MCRKRLGRYFLVHVCHFLRQSPAVCILPAPWSNIRIIEKIDIVKENLFWQEWRDILLAGYNGRLTALGPKGFGTVTGKKTFTAIFLQAKGFSVPTHEILPEAIRVVREKVSFPSITEYDAIAMSGHGIGMVENSAGIAQYLHRVRAVLKSTGQILLTSVDSPPVIESQHKLPPAFNNLQLQQDDIIGPFFAMLKIKADTLKNQAAAANWQCEIIYRQDETNYFARLGPIEPG
jgi:hypothetical protein